MSTDWGSLTGVRPVKIIHYLWKQGYKNNDIIRILSSKHGLNSVAIELIMSIAEQERALLSPFTMYNNKVALYVHIPFCPTRCSYCSFVSLTNKNSNEIRSLYLKALINEIKKLKDLLISNKQHVVLLYIGGGTPTVLNDVELQTLLSELKCFISPHLVEFTVEAGRPDTITTTKLNILRKYGVNRISINPQTMNALTLRRINRDHSINDIIETTVSAKNQGFIINMDLIIGLPGETTKDVIQTVTEIIKLNPQNITVHNLALKRTSLLNINQDINSLPSEKTVLDMNIKCREIIQSSQYKPYYLYRQKNTIGGHPNIGYTKSNYACLYNIAMISEQISIYGCGAGAVTKILDSQGKFKRLANPKDAEAYIRNVSKYIEKKSEVLNNESIK